MMNFASLLAADGGDDEPLLVFPKAVSGVNNIYNLTLALSGEGQIGNQSSSINNNNNKNSGGGIIQSLDNNSGGVRRNNTSSSIMESSSPSQEGQQQTNKSQRQPSADLSQILSQGQISFSQLENSKLLGKGNSGTGENTCALCNISLHIL